MRHNAFVAGAPLRTTPGELTELPRPHSWIWGNPRANILATALGSLVL